MLMKTLKVEFKCIVKFLAINRLQRVVLYQPPLLAVALSNFRVLLLLFFLQSVSLLLIPNPSTSVCLKEATAVAVIPLAGATWVKLEVEAIPALKGEEEPWEAGEVMEEEEAVQMITWGVAIMGSRPLMALIPTVTSTCHPRMISE